MLWNRLFIKFAFNHRVIRVFFSQLLPPHIPRNIKIKSDLDFISFLRMGKIVLYTRPHILIKIISNLQANSKEFKSCRKMWSALYFAHYLIHESNRFCLWNVAHQHYFSWNFNCIKIVPLPCNVDRIQERC